MARKVFISVLGATNYSTCDYQKDGRSYGDVRFIQEATLAYLNCKNTWTQEDVAYILLTKGSEQANWIDDGQKDRKTGEPIKQLGLKSTLDNLSLPFPIESIFGLPDGNTEKEIWEIFERVFSKIQDNDELYFDITHGFRYLPMLILVLCNYSKFLKNVIVKSITYGNYEVARELGHGLIVDLLPLAQLQDWTYAAGQYLDSGNVDKLVDLSRIELKPILKESQGKNTDAKSLNVFVDYLKKVVSERQTCRGMSIIRSENFAKLKECSQNVENSLIAPLNPIIEKIRKSLVFFDEIENAKNGFSAAKWCFDNGLYQQAATILQEFVVTFFCMRHNVKIDDENRREIVNQAFVLKFNHQEIENETNWSRVKEENKEMLRKVLSDELFDSKELVTLFNNLAEVRNDLNHSGMRSKREPLTPEKIKNNIEKCINGFAVILFNIDINSFHLC